MHGYEKTLKYKHHERPARVDMETGEVKEFKDRPNNIPKGKRKLNYTNFSIVNNDVLNRLSNLLTTEEVGVVFYMVGLSQIGTNSLKPLSNEVSIREISELFKVSRNKVPIIINKLYELGVYLRIGVFVGEDKDYWVLNPSISWKGKFVDDSLFLHFKGTVISTLLRK